MALADRLHQQAQQRLRTVTGAQVAAALTTAASLERSQELVDSYARGVARTVSGGQYAAARLAAAYVAAKAPPVRPPDLARALAELLITPQTPLAAAGLARLWALIDQGVSELEAQQSAGTYASGLAGTSLQAASRAGMDEAADATDREPRFRLELAPGACDWCHFIASTGDRYLSAESVPVPHSPGGRRPGGECNCSPAVEFEPVGIKPAPVRAYSHGRRVRG